MANRYPANLGDVFKHAVLCAAIDHEQPLRYVESHGGRFQYDLAGVTPGRGGVWDFMEVASGDPTLQSSSYAKALPPLVGSPDTPGTYPGSICLADRLLQTAADIVVFELDADSATTLRSRMATLRRPATVRVDDGVQGVIDTARPGDLVLIDPFKATERGPSGLSSIDAFSILADRGIAVLLWYGARHPHHRIEWPQEVNDVIDRPLWRAELFAANTQAGLAGCGILGANLRDDTEGTVSWLALSLGYALRSKVPHLHVAVARPYGNDQSIWHPFGCRRARLDEVRRLVANAGFPLIIKDRDGGWLFDAADANCVSVEEDEMGTVRIIIWNGIDHPGTVRVGVVLQEGILDEDGGRLYVDRAQSIDST